MDKCPREDVRQEKEGYESSSGAEYVYDAMVQEIDMAGHTVAIKWR